MRTLLTTTLLLVALFSFGQINFLKKKKNTFKIEQKKEVATDTTNSFKVTMEQPPKPTDVTYEELEALHKKGYLVEHELRDYIEIHPNDIKALYLYAKISQSHDSFSAIDKCISLHPNNLDYRKVRAYKLLRQKTQEDDMFMAIDDLTFVNANGGEHHKTHAGIGWAHKQLAQKTLRWRKPTIEKDPFGDNTAYNNAQIAIHQRRMEHYQKARKHYEKALEMGADHARITKSVFPSIDAGIAELEEIIAEQPHKN